jgi:hypothetical protein
MKLNWKVFAVAFVFSFVITVPSYASTILIRTLNHEMWDLVVFSTDVISFILSPLLLFASFYLIGRNIDLVSDFPSVLVPLFVASLAGRLVGYLSLYAGSYSAPSTLLEFLWCGLSLLRTAFSLEFFVGFTALAVAYIVKKRLTIPPSLGKE